MTPLEYRMHTDTRPLTVALQRREVLAVQVGAGLTVSCLDGRLLITQHRQRDDVVLEAGSSVELLQRGQAVLQALGAAVRVALTATAREHGPLRRGSIDRAAVGEGACG
jgi:Protein of unknown function (DUF2917)